MKRVGDEAAEQRRRAVASRKRGELWIVGENRMKRGEWERSCAARRQGGELWRERKLWRAVATKRAGDLWQGGEDKTCDNKRRREREL